MASVRIVGDKKKQWAFVDPSFSPEFSIRNVIDPYANKLTATEWLQCCVVGKLTLGEIFLIFCRKASAVMRVGADLKSTDPVLTPESSALILLFGQPASATLIDHLGAMNS